MSVCNVKVCRICFSMDCQLHFLNENMKLYNAYEAITELALADEEELPPYLCASCADQLVNCVRFKKRSLQAHLMFLDIVKNHGHISVESIHALIKPPHCDSDNKHTEEESTISNIKIEIKREDTPEDPVATELGDEIKKENTPDVIETDDDLVGDEDVVAPCVEETDDIDKEKMCDEASLNDVDDSKLGTGEDVSLDSDLPSEQENNMNIERAREGTEVSKYHMEVVQQHGAEVNEKPLQSVKLSSDVCAYENDSETQILSPVQSEAKTTFQYCYMCDFKTDSKNIFLAHITTHSGNLSHSTVPESRSRISSQINNVRKYFFCDICQTSYCSKGGFKRHMLIHTDDKQYVCDMCNKSYSVKASLIYHVQTHADKRFTCNICNNTFITKSKLKIHMIIHSGHKQYTCHLCDKSYYYKLNLQRHLLKHVDDKRFKCNVCHKSFHEKYVFKMHVLTHNGERPFTCEICNASFPTKSKLQRHKRTHTDNKPHACYICEKSFHEMCNLRRHLLVHAGIRPFSCDICNRSFSEKANLRRHILKHNDEKLYSCEVCKKTFRDAMSLKRHMHMHSNEKQR